MESTNNYLSILREIDRLEIKVSDWEAGFIESILRRNPSYLSDKQIGVINRMKDKYLDPTTQVEMFNDGLDDIPY